MKDLNGNELHVGDLVFTKVGSEWLQATITELKPGGTLVRGLTKGEVAMTPEVIIMTTRLFSAADPRQSVHIDMVKLFPPPQSKENGGPQPC